MSDRDRIDPEKKYGGKLGKTWLREESVGLVLISVGPYGGVKIQDSATGNTLPSAPEDAIEASDPRSWKQRFQEAAAHDFWPMYNSLIRAGTNEKRPDMKAHQLYWDHLMGRATEQATGDVPEVVRQFLEAMQNSGSLATPIEGRAREMP